MIFVPQSVSDNNIGAKTFHAFNQEGFQYLVYPLRMQPETVLVAPTGTILALYCTVLVVVCFFLSLTCSTSIVLLTGLMLRFTKSVSRLHSKSMCRLFQKNFIFSNCTCSTSIVLLTGPTLMFSNSVSRLHSRCLFQGSYNFQASRLIGGLFQKNFTDGSLKTP